LKRLLSGRGANCSPQIRQPLSVLGLSINIRSYNPTDFKACIAILKSNTPKYFSDSDEALYRSFLTSIPGEYFVVENGSNLVGCGGWAPNEDSSCALTWGLIQASQHRKGIGSQLLKFRLNRIASSQPSMSVRIETIPAVAPFFERFGFAATKKVKNGFGNGFDQWIMELGEGK